MYHPTIIYHVYNHSNNREVVFRRMEDFADFRLRLRHHLQPLTDILCYCLMPTHFHLLLLPKPIACAPAHPERPAVQQLHAAFRTLLSSYTQKTNLRDDRRGSLFRAKTKYKPGYSYFLPEDWELRTDKPFTRYVPYLKTCFRYIHLNPVGAALVAHPADWLHGSAPDYAGRRDDDLCNYALTEQLLGIRRLR